MSKMVTVELYEGKRKAESASVEWDGWIDWLQQQINAAGDRVTGVTLHTTPPKSKNLGKMVGEK